MAFGSDVGGGSMTLRVGLAILYVADTRALQATLDTIALLDEAPARTLVLKWPAFSTRTLPEAPIVVNHEYQDASGSANVRQMALDILADCDLIFFIKEGIVTSVDFVSFVRGYFERSPHLRVLVANSPLMLSMKKFSATSDQMDPFSSVKRSGEHRPRFASRYYTPCILCVATGRGTTGKFETFSRRSEWAAAKLFCEAYHDETVHDEIMTTKFGLIANIPDQRDSARQGQQVCDELYRFSLVTKYSNLAKADMQRLVFEQLVGILRLTQIVSRLRFLGGMSKASKVQRTLQRKLIKDIRSMG